MTSRSIAFLSGLFWSLAFFLSLGTVPPLEIERLEAVLVGLGALAPLLACGAPLAGRGVVAPGIARLVVLFWLLVAVSCAWSVSPPVSLIYAGIFSILPATVLAVAVADAGMRAAFLRAAFCGCGVIVVGLAAWALAQIFFFPEMLVNRQVRDPFANPNVFAALLGLSFFAGLGFYLQEHGRWAQIIITVALAIILAAFMAMGSKAASATMAGGAAMMVIACGRTALRPHWRVLAAVIIAAAAVQVLIAFLPGRANLVGQMATMIDDNALSARVRIDIWRATMAMIAEHPWLGGGYRSFFLTYPAYRLPSESWSGGTMAHSDPLQFWAEMGIGGIVLFYAIGIGVMLRFMRFWRGGSEHGPAVALFAGCAAFIVHAHVDFPFYAMPATMVFALALAALLAATEPDREDNTPLAFMARWPRGAAAMALMAPVAGLMILFIPLMLGEYYTNRADRLIKTGQLQAFGETINNAGRVGHGLNDRPYLLASAVPLGLLQTRGGTMPRAEQEKLFRQIEGLLARALERNAMMAAAWHQRGAMRLALDPAVPPPGYPTAEECFQKALAINPQYLPSRLALAEGMEKDGRNAQALEVLLAGLPWPYTQYAAMDYYARTEKLARGLKREDLMPRIEQYRQLQQSRIAAGRQTRARLSTAN